MSDLRFDDVVDLTTTMSGGRACAICKTCSERYKVTRDEFVHPTHKRLEETEDGLEFVEFVPDEVDEDFLEYVAGMRAWNCCHEDEEPLDGFPEQPPEPYGFEFDR